MATTWCSYRQESKKPNLGGNHEVGFRPCDEQIKLGAILRIADATELMAENYQQLIDERDSYKRFLQGVRENNKLLLRQIAGLKGYITQLKVRKR